MEHYDFVVIGAGPAGEKAATQAAYFGKRVAIVEKTSAPGGIAVSDAGIPTKTLRETAQYLTGFRHRDIYGVSLALDANLKLQRLTARTSEVQALMTQAVRDNIARMGVDLIHGAASLGKDRLVHVALAGGGQLELQAERILIASGSRPYHPPGIPFDDPAISDSERILKLSALPRSLIVIGAGAIGCEYASIFTALGVEVTLVDSAARMLAFMDAEISQELAKIFRAMGMRVLLGARLREIQRQASGLEVLLEAGEPLRAEHVLFAAGRTGNLEGLGLAAAGVEFDAKNRIKVDERYRTSAEGIYAAGDVIGPPALASVSMEQGRVAACYAFDIPFKGAVDPLAPFGVYCIPEVAMAGLTEEAARAGGIDYEVGRAMFARNSRARIAGTTEGMIKLVFRRADRVLLGVHILGDIASELVHLGQHVASEGGTIDRFIHATFNVPTYSDAYKYAAYDGLQKLRGR
jgi:NAD(P) transhydrogenase